MKLDHKGIKDLLPEYVSGRVTGEMKELIEAHRAVCHDCNDEIEMLTSLCRIDIPDPGDLYWKSLPGKVRALAEEKRPAGFSIRSYLLRPVYVAVLIVIIIASIYLYPSGNGMYYDPLFESPFNGLNIDYGTISEDSIPELTIEVAYNDLDLDRSFYEEYSYLQDLTSLCPDDLDLVYRELQKIRHTGG